MSIPLKLLIVLSLLCAPVISSSFVSAPSVTASKNQLNTGYSALKFFLEDEQHLTTIRRIKAVIAFGGINEPSEKIIDEIADSSSASLEKLEELSTNQPTVNFVVFSDEKIGKATLDSIRMATAKDFLFNGDSFEKDLLISQTQVLKVISHLAKQLAEQEINTERKEWLLHLAKQYEDFYSLVYKRLALV
jgi:hypothetical protein